MAWPSSYRPQTWQFYLFFPALFISGIHKEGWVGHVTRSCKGPCCKRWIYSPSGRKLLVSSFRLSWTTTTLLTAPKFWVFLDTKFAIDLLIIKSICTFCAFCCFQNGPMSPMIRSAPNIFHRKCVSFECLTCSVLWILSDVRKQSPFKGTVSRHRRLGSN